VGAHGAWYQHAAILTRLGDADDLTMLTMLSIGPSKMQCKNIGAASTIVSIVRSSATAVTHRHAKGLRDTKCRCMTVRTMPPMAPYPPRLWRIGAQEGAGSLPIGPLKFLGEARVGLAVAG